jgi:hypothetical protein
MRRRAEVEVGVRGGDADGARVARVEQDQRERSLLSSHSAQPSSTSADSSTSLGLGSGGVTGAQVTVGVDTMGESSCEA